MNCSKPILLVEDDKIDVMTMQRAIKDLKITNPLEITGNGEEALNHLNKIDNELPCLILLDINMPKMNGIEFLKIIKKNDRLKVLPVVVLTSSKEEQDKLDSFGLGIAGYMLKPADYKKFVEVIRAIDIYWTASEQPC